MALQPPFQPARPALPAVSPVGSRLRGAAGMPTPGSNAGPVSGAMEPDHLQRMIVGRGVHMRGVEITDCEVLVVEGSLEGLADKPVAAHRLHVGAMGQFRGNAQVESAEIHGRFEGHLVVREKLVIFPKGQVKGQLRYGLLVVEEGGQLVGDIAAAQAPEGALAPSQDEGPGEGGVAG